MTDKTKNIIVESALKYLVPVVLSAVIGLFAWYNKVNTTAVSNNLLDIRQDVILKEHDAKFKKQSEINQQLLLSLAVLTERLQGEINHKKDKISRASNEEN